MCVDFIAVFYRQTHKKRPRWGEKHDSIVLEFFFLLFEHRFIDRTADSISSINHSITRKCKTLLWTQQATIKGQQMAHYGERNSTSGRHVDGGRTWKIQKSSAPNKIILLPPPPLLDSSWWKIAFPSPHSPDRLSSCVLLKHSRSGTMWRHRKAEEKTLKFPFLRCLQAMFLCRLS